MKRKNSQLDDVHAPQSKYDFYSEKRIAERTRSLVNGIKREAKLGPRYWDNDRDRHGEDLRSES